MDIRTSIMVPESVSLLSTVMPRTEMENSVKEVALGYISVYVGGVFAQYMVSILPQSSVSRQVQLVTGYSEVEINRIYRSPLFLCGMQVLGIVCCHMLDQACNLLE